MRAEGGMQMDAIKRFKKIARNLYCYYGVSEEDIKNRTKRYSSLVTELSS